MKGTKLLLSLWLSTVAFCVLQILFGPTGFTETARLKEYRTRLESRLSALETDNIRLIGRYEALRTSSEAVRLQARTLGYFRTGDTPVLTPGSVGFRLPSDQPDLTLVRKPPSNDPGLTVFFRLAWPLLLLSFVTIFHLWERLRPPAELEEEAPPPLLEKLPAPLPTGLDFFRK
jgi:hypothetical protein